MKKVFIIVFDNDEEMSATSERIQIEKSDDSKVYCGSWGKIHFNKDECLKAISETVNHFIKLPEIKEVYFGCNRDDVSEIKKLLLLDGCEIVER